MRSFFRAFWRWLQLVVPFGLLVRPSRATTARCCASCGEPRALALRAAHLAPRRVRRLLARPARPARRRHPRRAPVPDAAQAARLNTMGAIPDAASGDVRRLRAMTNEELHRLGRVPYPLLRRTGDAGFRRISWDEAARLSRRGDGAQPTPRPHGLVRQLSRGLTNEAYYASQKLARIAGTATRRQLRAPVPRGVERRASSRPSAGARPPARSRT